MKYIDVYVNCNVNCDTGQVSSAVVLFSGFAIVYYLSHLIILLFYTYRFFRTYYWILTVLLTYKLSLSSDNGLGLPGTHQSGSKRIIRPYVECQGRKGRITSSGTIPGWPDDGICCPIYRPQNPLHTNSLKPFKQTEYVVVWVFLEQQHILSKYDAKKKSK